MRFSKLFVNCVCAFMLLPLAMHSQPESSFEYTSSAQNRRQDIGENVPIFSYDEILMLVESLENGNLEQYSDQELNEINHYISFLARQGILSGNLDDELTLEEDIQELLKFNPGFAYSYHCGNDCMIVPAMFSGDFEVMLCKSWFKKQWDNTRKFVKKHKTEILIGVAIVITVTVVVVVLTTSGGAAAPAVAGALAAGAQGLADSESIRNDYGCENEKNFAQTQDVGPVNDQCFEEFPSITLQSAIQEQVLSFKDQIVAEDLMVNDFFVDHHSLIHYPSQTLGETVRQLGSFLAHETLDEISELVLIIPQLAEEVRSISEQVIPKLSNGVGDNRLSPTEKFSDLITSGHEKIDQLFTTNYAPKYSPEAKESNRDNFSIGILPPPSFCNGLFSDTKRLSAAGEMLDRAGLTKAGRGLMKHGYREGSAFPKPVGNVTHINAHGQDVLETILNHPERKFIEGEYKRYGKVVDIVVPGVGGARYDVKGNFIGFLEP